VLPPGDATAASTTQNPNTDTTSYDGSTKQKTLTNGLLLWNKGGSRSQEGEESKDSLHHGGNNNKNDKQYGQQ
jgi:hypothetical protein